MRRELVIDGYLKPNNELLFSAIVLTFKPKCAEIFNYRKWIYFNVLKGRSILITVAILYNYSLLLVNKLFDILK